MTESEAKGKVYISRVAALANVRAKAEAEEMARATVRGGGGCRKECSIGD